MTVIFYGNILKFTNDEKSLEVNDCGNVYELFDKLAVHYGEGLKQFLLGEETCLILRNGTGLMMTGGLNTKLKPDDKIEILPFAGAG